MIHEAAEDDALRSPHQQNANDKTQNRATKRFVVSDPHILQHFRFVGQGRSSLVIAATHHADPEDDDKLSIASSCGPADDSGVAERSACRVSCVRRFAAELGGWCLNQSSCLTGAQSSTISSDGTPLTTVASSPVFSPTTLEELRRDAAHFMVAKKPESEHESRLLSGRGGLPDFLLAGNIAIRLTKQDLTRGGESSREALRSTTTRVVKEDERCRRVLRRFVGARIPLRLQGSDVVRTLVELFPSVALYTGIDGGAVRGCDDPSSEGMCDVEWIDAEVLPNFSAPPRLVPPSSRQISNLVAPLARIGVSGAVLELKPKAVFRVPSVAKARVTRSSRQEQQLVDEGKSSDAHDDDVLLRLETPEATMRQCRFSLMQFYKRQKALVKKNKKENHDTFRLSRYCPNLLLAPDATVASCMKALKLLRATPQNNFREEHDISTEDESVDEDYFLTTDAVVSAALIASGVLSKLRALQLQPTLDIAVLQPLVEWCAQENGLRHGDQEDGRLSLEFEGYDCGDLSSVGEGCDYCGAELHQHSSDAGSTSPPPRTSSTVASTAMGERAKNKTMSASAESLGAFLAEETERFYSATTARDCSIMVALSAHQVNDDNDDAEQQEYPVAVYDAPHQCLKLHVRTVAAHGGSDSNGVDVEVRLLHEGDRRADQCPSGTVFNVRVAVVDIESKRHKPLSHYKALDDDIRLAAECPTP